MKLFYEQLEKTGIATIYITLPKNIINISKIKISIKNGDICVNWGNPENNITTIRLQSKTEFNISTINSIHSLLIIRLRFKNITQIPKLELDRSKPYQSNNELAPKQYQSLLCKHCSSLLSNKDVICDRVIVLPSSDWEFHQDLWTCGCSHSPAENFKPDSNIFSDKYSHLHRAIFLSRNFVILPKEAIKNASVGEEYLDKGDKSKLVDCVEDLGFLCGKTGLSFSEGVCCGDCKEPLGFCLGESGSEVERVLVFKWNVKSLEDCTQKEVFSSYSADNLTADEIKRDIQSKNKYKFVVTDSTESSFLRIKIISPHIKVWYYNGEQTDSVVINPFSALKLVWYPTEVKNDSELTKWRRENDARNLTSFRAISAFQQILEENSTNCPQIAAFLEGNQIASFLRI